MICLFLIFLLVQLSIQPAFGGFPEIDKVTPKPFQYSDENIVPHEECRCRRVTVFEESREATSDEVPYVGQVFEEIKAHDPMMPLRFLRLCMGVLVNGEWALITAICGIKADLKNKNHVFKFGLGMDHYLENIYHNTTYNRRIVEVVFDPKFDFNDIDFEKYHAEKPYNLVLLKMDTPFNLGDYLSLGLYAACLVNEKESMLSENDYLVTVGYDLSNRLILHRIENEPYTIVEKEKCNFQTYPNYYCYIKGKGKYTQNTNQQLYFRDCATDNGGAVLRYLAHQDRFVVIALNFNLMKKFDPYSPTLPEDHCEPRGIWFFIKISPHLKFIHDTVNRQCVQPLISLETRMMCQCQNFWFNATRIAAAHRCASLQVAPKTLNPREEEYYGTDAGRGDFRYAAAIFTSITIATGSYPAMNFTKYYEPKCGATILNRFWSLTSADCAYEFKDYKGHGDYSRIRYMIAAGKHHFLPFNTRSKLQHKEIKRVVIHPKYDSITKPLNDLALIKVSEPFRFNTHTQILPTCLKGFSIRSLTDPFEFRHLFIMSHSPNGTKAVLNGNEDIDHEHAPEDRQGSIEIQGHIFKTKNYLLQFTRVQYVDRLKGCAKTDPIICTTSFHEKLCVGVTGYPLVAYSQKQKRYYVIGISVDTQVTHDGCEHLRYQRHVDIYWHLDWINDVVGDNTMCPF